MGCGASVEQHTLNDVSVEPQNLKQQAHASEVQTAAPPDPITDFVTAAVPAPPCQTESMAGQNEDLARQLSDASRGTPRHVRESEFLQLEQMLRIPRRRLTKEVSQSLEYAAGSCLTDTEVWSGRFVVMSGEASIQGTSGDGKTDTTIAMLRPGNSFGWSTPEELSRWESLRTRIVVGQLQPLRICQSDSEIVNEATFTVGHANFLELEGLSRQFADLWLHTSAPSVGIGVQTSGRFRAQFMAALWGPLLDRFEEHDDEIRRRKRRGYRIHDQFPLQGHQISELRDYIMHLTDIWYGSEKGGNLSALYRWFMKSMDAIGVTAYSMDDIPIETSPDGWATVLDGNTRREALRRKGGAAAAHVATGGLNQKQGRSAIDNTVLVNVFTAAEARVLLIGRFLRKVLCKFIAIRQRCILRKLSDHLNINFESHASEDGTGRGHRLVRAILRALSAEDFSAAGIQSDSFCFRELLLRGSILSGFGQLESDHQKTVWEFASTLVLPGRNPQDIGPQEGSEDVFDRMVVWSRKNPGEYFEKNRLRHFEVMLGGIWCDKVVLVKRSAMERMTMARYFAMSWTRSQPLWAVFAAGEPNKLRECGSKEASRVRANECPYARMHGMSMPTGGFARDERRKGDSKKKETGLSRNLMFEAQWVQDPAGNIENWFLTDIEKIVQESWSLNPHGDKSMMLPGEMFVNVGQNPKIGSSIKQTQHTQLCEASVASFPLLRVESPNGPRHSKSLSALVDFIDIGPIGAGEEVCTFFVKVIADQPTAPAIVAFLVELRLRLLAQFGGAEALDFLVTSMSDERGCFVILFAPIPHLVKIGTEPPDLASWANPLTGESSETADLAEARLDFGKGVGHFLCMKPSLRDQLLSDGEDTMRRIWAFNRVPGVREAVLKFADEKKLFEHPAAGALS